MTAFLCKQCRFKYTPKSDRKEAPAICGNCGTKGSVVAAPDANQILQDSDLSY